MQTYMTQDYKKLKSLDWSCLLLFLSMIRVEGGQEQDPNSRGEDGEHPSSSFPLEMYYGQYYQPQPVIRPMPYAVHHPFHL